MIKLLVLILATALGVSSSLHGETIYVDATPSSDGNDGTSWENAFQHLQDAIAAAQAGDEIWVAQGTYTPDQGAGQTPGDRDASFSLKSDVAIYGGFLGTETDLIGRDHSANPTILSGDLLGNDDNSDEERSENSYNVVSGTSVNSSAVINGFTITAGYANGSTIYQINGGGAYVRSASPSFAKCTFSENYADEEGGAVHNAFSNATFTDCLFIENSTDNRGGAAYNSHSSPGYFNCSFVGNSATRSGGAIYSDTTTPTLTNCSFSTNSAAFGGALYHYFYDAILTNCSFSENFASDKGGAICNSSSDPVISACIFSENSAAETGGAVFNFSSSPSFIDCELSGNTANIGGAISNQSSSSPSFISCKLSGNSAGDKGGAIFDDNSNPSFINCVVSGNSADLGGAVYNESGSSSSITNCTLSGNRASTSGGAIYILDSNSGIANSIIWNNLSQSDTSSSHSIENVNSSPVFTHCLIQHFTQEQLNASGTGNFEGTDPINNPLFRTPIDPLLAPTTQGDLSLKLDSPAIDAANFDKLPSSGIIATDFLGNPRAANDPDHIDTGAGSITFLDLGAFELVPVQINNFTLLATTTTDATELRFSLELNENVFNFEDASDLIVTTTFGLSYSEIVISGSNKSYTIDILGISGEGEISISLNPESDASNAENRSIAYHPGIVKLPRLSNGSPIHFVNTTSSNPVPPFNTWETASDNLQDALALANTSDQIWVSKGSYTPDQGEAQIPGNREATFRLKPNVALHGGFAGSETEKNQRSQSQNPSILSGDLLEDDHILNGSRSENSYHVITGIDLNSSAIVDGFSIISGNADGPDDLRSGGGAHLINSSATFINCSFSGNSAVNGGAVSNVDHSSPTLINCAFFGNLAQISGGAIRNSSYSSPSLINCSLSGNTASKGGAIYNYWLSVPTLANCIIWNNVATAFDPPFGTEPSSINSVFNNYRPLENCTNCLIQHFRKSSLDQSGSGNIDGWDSTNNPLFLVPPDPDNAPSLVGDLRIRPDSPAIDSASYDNYPANIGPEMDIAGNSRFLDIESIEDSGTGSITFLDLGPFEHSFLHIKNFELLNDNTVNASELTFSLEFFEEAIDLDNHSDLIINTTLNASYNGLSISGSGTEYLITLHNINGEGHFSLSLNTESDIQTTTGLPLAKHSGVQNVLHLDSTSPIHFVNIANPNPSPPYDTWETAANHIQDALVYAAPGDQIWVTNGIYTPDQGAGITSGDKEASFHLKSGVALYGGFTGIETSPSQRDHMANLTILSGDLLQNDSDPSGDRSDNSIHVIVANDTSATTELNGFTIKSGNAFRSGSAGSAIGGGIYMTNSSSVIRHCTFIDNAADYRGGAIFNISSSPTIADCVFSSNSGHGSGICNTDNSSPNITNCTFFESYIANIDNSTPSIIDCSFTNSIRGIHNSSSSPSISNCSFINNTNTSNGGAVYNSDGSSPTLTDCDFIENQAGRDGGAIYNTGGSNPILTNCFFSRNSSTEDGGAIFNTNSHPSLNNCSFSENTADNGGAFYNYRSSPTLNDCTFTENTADDDGGAIYSYWSSSPTISNCRFLKNLAIGEGGAIFNRYESFPTLTGCFFTENSARSGAGIYNSSCSPFIIECSFLKNSASRGGAINNYLQSSPTISRTIFSGNTATISGGAAYNSASPATYTDCSFIGNSTGSIGGAVYNSSGSGVSSTIIPMFTNCSFSGNLANARGGAIFNDSSYSPDFVNCVIWNNHSNGVPDTTSIEHSVYNRNSTPTFTNCLVEHYTKADLDTTGSNNLEGTSPDNNPLFTIPVDPMAAPTTDGDLRLLIGSPAIDVGSNLANEEDYDLLGNPRIQNEVINLGAYETPYSPVYYEWTALMGLTPGINDSPTDTPLPDLSNNLLDFAFGLDPLSHSSPLTLGGDGGLELLSRGTAALHSDETELLATFLRRKDRDNAGIRYDVQLSSDLINWHTSLDVPIIQGDYGEMELVSVPFPESLPDLSKPKFVRVQITLQ